MTFSKIMRHDVVTLSLVIASACLLIGGPIGVFLREESSFSERLSSIVLVVGLYLGWMALVYLRVIYLRWLLYYPCLLEGKLQKDDRRYIVNGPVGNICYSFVYQGKEYTHCASFFLSQKFRGYLASSDCVTICFYPPLKLSLIKSVFD